jgi:hypothetical protein
MARRGPDHRLDRGAAPLLARNFTGDSPMYLLKVRLNAASES